MKCNKWTIVLLGAGLVSAPSVASADEKPSSVLTALSATTISGYVDTSMVLNPGTSQNLPLYTPNGAPSSTKANGFNLDSVMLTLSKPVGEGEWSAGYNIGLLFGPDAVGFNNSFGSAASDFSLVDTYVVLRAPIGNGLDFKVGTFASPLGYEVYQAGLNPNFTRSYGYELEPTQLTGVQVAYQFNSIISANAGVVNTWSAGVNNRAFEPQGAKPAGFETYLGSITLTAPDSLGFLSGSTLTGGIVSGANLYYRSSNLSVAPSNFGVTETSFYAGSTIKTPLKWLSVGVAFDYECLGPNRVALVANSSGFQMAAAGYLSIQPTEKLSVNLRADYLDQSSYLGQALSPGLPGEAFAFTASVGYDLWKNVLTRAEFRWDHALNGSSPWGPAPTTLDNTYMVALNIIYKF
ncbi:MAG TPA: outer membrane beta-barrel protein [Candidatus Acidoferrum sp.]|nr:outer membrane beta-barrel protein [Candidatus Acidoferrum sp.]